VNWNPLIIAKLNELGFNWDGKPLPGDFAVTKHTELTNSKQPEIRAKPCKPSDRWGTLTTTRFVLFGNGLRFVPLGRVTIDITKPNWERDILKWWTHATFAAMEIKSAHAAADAHVARIERLKGEGLQKAQKALEEGGLTENLRSLMGIGINVILDAERNSVVKTTLSVPRVPEQYLLSGPSPVRFIDDPARFDESVVKLGRLAKFLQAEGWLG